MADYYKRLEPLGSASESDANAAPVPRQKPTAGQRLKALALGHNLNVPEGVDFDLNIVRSRKFDLIPLDFYHQVKSTGPWDYKNKKGKKYEDFGNYHFGVMARAAGFKRDTILRMAGWAQQRDNDNIKDSWTDWGSAFLPILGLGGKPPFGDHAHDQDWITKGMDDYDKVHGTGKYAEIPLYLHKPGF